MTDTEYLIYSHEHRAWWKPARHGYTNNLFDIGRYTKDDAQRICEDANYRWMRGGTPEYGDLPAEVTVPLPAGFVTTVPSDALAGLQKAVDEATAAAIRERDTRRGAAS